jgi:CRP-like cAMP-binding protein
MERAFKHLAPLTLGSSFQEELLTKEGVTRLTLTRRASAVFTSGSVADRVYYLDSGLVKLERTTDSSKDLLLGVVAPGELFGEQAILGEGTYSTTARVLESGVAYAIPSDIFQAYCDRRPAMWRYVVDHLLRRRTALEQKIEHLCLSDVRQRIIFYLDELAQLSPATEPAGNVIHISQNELASLVGATRETTSTTLNSLARQGLIVLGHRMVMIPSLAMLRSALTNGNKAAAATAKTGPPATQA